MGQVRALPTHDEAGLRVGFGAGKTVVHGASGASNGRIGQDGDTALLKQIANRGFHLSLRQRRYDTLVVGYSIKIISAGHYGDAHPIHIRVQQVAAVAGRVHPPIVNRGRRRRKGNILLDEAEVSAGLCGARREVEFARILMGDGSFGCHAQTMLAGGCSQCRVPLERRSPSRGARLIGQSEQLLSFRLKNLPFSTLQRTSRLRLRE